MSDIHKQLLAMAEEMPHDQYTQWKDGIDIEVCTSRCWKCRLLALLAAHSPDEKEQEVLGQVSPLPGRDAELPQDSLGVLRELADRLSKRSFPITPHDTAEACVTMVDVQEVCQSLASDYAKARVRT
jgi:hypothetical protein